MIVTRIKTIYEIVEKGNNMFLAAIDVQVIPDPEKLTLMDGLLNGGFLVGAIVLTVALILPVLALKRRNIGLNRELLVGTSLMFGLAATSAFTAASLSNINTNIDNQLEWFDNLKKADDDARNLAESKILENYSLDSNVSKLEHIIEDKKIVESTTKYTDSKTNTRYELIFTFDENQKANLLKNSTVDEALINKLEK
jgi:hypothetical protein